MESQDFNLNQPNADLTQPADAGSPVESTSPRKRSLAANRGNLLLIGLFVAALVGIYVIHLKGGPAKASAAVKETETRMEAFLKTLNSPQAKDSRAEAIANTFYYEAQQRQIPAAQLHNNPFIFKALVAAPRTTQPAASAATPAFPSEDQAKLLSQALANAKTLNLQSIMMGSETKAMISNNLLSVGEHIAGWTIVEIGSRQVILKWKDQTYTLYMQ